MADNKISFDIDRNGETNETTSATDVRPEWSSGVVIVAHLCDWSLKWCLLISAICML